jgi:hypothetical protein
MSRDAHPAPAPDEVADAVELLGLVAQLEDSAFARLAADAANAPEAADRLILSRFAAQAVDRRDRVLARVAELGADPAAAIARFDRVLDDLDARTQPSTWWERLLKGYVGSGVSDDFCRLAAQGLDPASRDLVLDVLDDAAHAELSVRAISGACETDEALNARLALWGRRVVGESLQIVQRLLVSRPGLARLSAHGMLMRRAMPALDEAGEAVSTVAPAAVEPAGSVVAGSDPAVPSTAPASPAPGKVLNELTAKHTRRMSRLKLTA